MFIITLFIMTKTWRQPNCSSIEDWIKEKWYIYTMEYYSSLRKGKKLPFVTKCIDFESIMLSEIGQKKLKII